jgi:hypothetical protein
MQFIRRTEIKSNLNTLLGGLIQYSYYCVQIRVLMILKAVEMNNILSFMFTVVSQPKFGFFHIQSKAQIPVTILGRNPNYIQEPEKIIRL